MGSSYFYLEFLVAWVTLLREAGYRNPTIFALEYSLVPDATYPTQVEQTMAGYEYVCSVTKDASRVCVGGDSAGATLILSLLLRLARWNNDKSRPGYAVLISPWTTLVSPKNRDTASDYLNANSLHLYGRQYASSVANIKDPLVSPAVTPLDLVKCRRQVDPKIYSSNISAWRSIYAKEGIRGVFFGWSPTFIGYSFQGAGKYGFYEVFKYIYGDKMFPNMNKTVVYLGASASAEFLADVALCPFEAIKVRMQTSIPPFANTLREGWGKVTAKEGTAGLYKGLYPLWGRQIPYTMVKFATFETTVNYIYATLGKPKESYNALQQTGVSFLGGYIAGIGCAVISHPADVMVSKLNADRQPGESGGKAMSRIYGNIGFKGLWNGLPVRIVMIGTLTAFQWLIYDSFKVSLGLPTTGGH
ncbi:hypothetical protein MMC22_005051 [Lobaria immixta]|nr:hypothetical protein [Lobaria immixta]